MERERPTPVLSGSTEGLGRGGSRQGRTSLGMASAGRRDKERRADVLLSSDWPRLPGRTSGAIMCYQVRGPGDAEQGQGGLPTQHRWSLSLQRHPGHAFTLRDMRHG